MQRGRSYSTDRLMDALRSEGITTWFNLGLMLDRLRDGRDTPRLIFNDNFDAFTQHICHGVGLVFAGAPGPGSTTAGRSHSHCRTPRTARYDRTLLIRRHAAGRPAGYDSPPAPS